MGRKKSSGVSQYSAPPETELKLQELQKAFNEDRNNKQVRNDYFSLIRIYARSLALKEIKRHNIYLSPERVDEICTDATLSIFKQYEKEGWSIQASFAGVLYWKIREAMYSQANEEMMYSLNSKFSEDDRDSKEMLDIMGTNACLPWQVGINSLSTGVDCPEDTLIKDINVAYDETQELIDQAYQILPYDTFLKFVPWLVLRFRRPKTRNCYQTFDKTFLSNKEENAFEILLLELRDRIANHT